MAGWTYDTSDAGVNNTTPGWPRRPRGWYIVRMSDESRTIVPAIRAVLDEALAAGRTRTLSLIHI